MGVLLEANLGNPFYWDWEYDVLYWFQSIQNPVLTAIMKAITFLGNSGWFWIAITLLLLFFQKDKKMGWTSFVSLLLTLLITNLILKNAFARMRPYFVPEIGQGLNLLISKPSEFSFPSGHTSCSFSSAVAIFTRDKKWGTAAIIVATLVGISRMYFTVHYPTDVIGGVVVGILDGILAYIIVNAIYKRRANKELTA